MKSNFKNISKIGTGYNFRDVKDNEVFKIFTKFPSNDQIVINIKIVNRALSFAKYFFILTI